jgi:acyl-CoA thioesterase FadM
MSRMTARIPKRRWTVTVVFDTDDRRGIVKEEDVLEYVDEAVSAWHGQKGPDDPLQANVKGVHVTKMKTGPVR